MLASLLKRELSLWARPGMAALLAGPPAALALGQAFGLPPSPVAAGAILAAAASLGLISSLEADRGNDLLWMILDRRGTYAMIVLKAAFAMTGPLIFLLALGALKAAFHAGQAADPAWTCLAAAAAVVAGAVAYGLFASPPASLGAAWAAAAVLPVPLRALLEGAAPKPAVWLALAAAAGLALLAAAARLHRKLRIDDEAQGP